MAMNSCWYHIHFRAFVKWSLDLELETCISTVLPAGLFLISGVWLIPRYGKWISNCISSITRQTPACWENLLWMSVYAIYPNTRFVKHFCYQVINLINIEPYHQFTFEAATFDHYFRLVWRLDLLARAIHGIKLSYTQQVSLHTILLL